MLTQELERTARHASLGLPLAARSSKGGPCWYVLRVPEGREQATAEKLRSIVSSDLLGDVFAPRAERWIKRAGVWFTSAKLLYSGYLFAVTDNVEALEKALTSMSFPVELVGSRGRSFAPLSEQARMWFERVMDEAHVIRTSTANIESGVLHVQTGPLVGQEDRIERVDRHKRSCLVRVGEGDHSFIVRLALGIPEKS